jgi:hypothetical protein
VGDAVDDKIVLRWVIVSDSTELQVFSDNVAFPTFVNLLDEGLGKRFFPANQNSYPLHV